MPSELQTFVATKEIAIESRHVGLTTDDDKWSHDEWRVTLTYQGRTYGMSYRTGLGHRVCAPGVRKEHGGWSRANSTDFERSIEKACMRGMLKPHAPSVADVVYSLCSDASGASESFESWCGDYGYDNDSIKALNIYRACQQTRDALLKLFGRELFEELCSKEH